MPSQTLWVSSLARHDMTTLCGYRLSRIVGSHPLVLNRSPPTSRPCHKAADFGFRMSLSQHSRSTRAQIKSGTKRIGRDVSSTAKRTDGFPAKNSVINRACRCWAHRPAEVPSIVGKLRSCRSRVPCARLTLWTSFNPLNLPSITNILIPPKINRNVAVLQCRRNGPSQEREPRELSRLGSLTRFTDRSRSARLARSLHSSAPQPTLSSVAQSTAHHTNMTTEATMPSPVCLCNVMITSSES